MLNLKNINDIKMLKGHFEVCFNNPSGDEVVEFLEAVCNWYPLAGESNETNDVLQRDARRQVLASIKTMLKCSPEEIQRVGQLID